jgi:hypothetical protein
VVRINFKEIPIRHLFNKIWIFEVRDQARDKRDVRESFAGFPLGIKARLVAVKTFLVILSRANKTAARVDATIIWYWLE